MPGHTLLILTILLLCFCSSSNLQDDGNQWILGVEELYRLDQLPAFKKSIRVASISSYDRTGGNDDGFSGKYSYVRKEKDGLVIADLKGPGIIYRIWTPTPTEDLMELYFDGEKESRIQLKCRDLFTGKEHPFIKPIVGHGVGGFYCYLPIPFQKSCKILIKTEKVQFYQINYAIYPPKAPIKTYDPDLTEEFKNRLMKAQKLFSSFGSDISQYLVEDENKIQQFTSNKTLEPGKTVTIFKTNRPGRIIGLRLSPAMAFVGKGRDVLLKIYWDGDEEPAVISPVGDFFGYAWGQPAVKSLLVGTSGEVNYTYFPMPFDQSAKIELVSEKASGTPVDVHAEVAFAPISRKKNEGKFYAIWKRENPTTKGIPFKFIETEGKGHLVGCILQAQGLESRGTPFFEGDDQTTIDGELVIHGTGSEDFFNGGWYDVPGRWEKQRSFPLSGCLAYKKALARTGGYRLMIGDAYAYQKSILQTIEHAPTENSLLTDYAGVTFLYSEIRPTFNFSVPPLEERKVLDPAKIVFNAGWTLPIHAFSFRDATLYKRIERVDDESLTIISLRAKDEDIFGPHFISFMCEIPATGKYNVSIEALKGPDQCQVQLFMDEAPVGEIADLYAPQKEKSDAILMGVLDLEEGVNNIMFKLVGKNEESAGLAFDLMNIICEKIE